MSPTRRRLRALVAQAVIDSLRDLTTSERRYYVDMFESVHSEIRHQEQPEVIVRLASKAAQRVAPPASLPPEGTGGGEEAQIGSDEPWKGLQKLFIAGLEGLSAELEGVAGKFLKTFSEQVAERLFDAGVRPPMLTSVDRFVAWSLKPIRSALQLDGVGTSQDVRDTKSELKSARGRVRSERTEVAEERAMKASERENESRGRAGALERGAERPSVRRGPVR
ncbi:MAG: hypothetical protein Q7W02_11690 [Candidatus Rokubacteria bacterium]|nr:hypothetical protein [Candidatus Rokubacteria bacterium]